MSAPRFPGAGRLERRRTLRRIAAVGALVVALLVSALLWPRQQAGGLRVATTDDARASGVVRGELRGQRVGDRVCFGVRGTAGPALLLLPRGWSADERRALLDPGGAPIARPGDTVLVTGEPRPVGRIDGCPGSGRVWAVAALVLPR